MNAIGDRSPVVIVLSGRCDCQDVIWVDPSESSNEV